MNQDPISKARTLLWDIFALFFTILICLFYVALLSYSPLDTAFNSTYFPPQPVHNFVGTWGANWSANALYFFGFASYFLPIAILFMIFRHFKRNLSLGQGLAFTISLIFLYVSLVYILYSSIPVIKIQDFDLSSVGNLGLWVHSHFYAKLGNISSLTSSVCLGLLALIITNFEKFKRFSHLFPKKK